MYPNLLKSIAIEGGDGSGKNTAIVHCVNRLQKSTKLVIDDNKVIDRGFRIVLTNFPQYMLPVGWYIRMMQKKDGLGFFENNIKTSSLKISIIEKIRKAMYGLDRLFAWCILDSYLKKNRRRNIIYLSDRSPFSHCNTIAYIYEHKEDFNWSIHIDNVTDSDTELLNAMKYRPVVLLAQKMSIFRKSLDLMEGTSQIRAREGFELLAKKYSSLPVYTQNSDGTWRNLDDITNETLKSVGIVITREGNKTINTVFVVGPSEFIKYFRLKNYISNDTNSLIDEWKSVSLSNESSIRGMSKKEYLNLIETDIAQAILDAMVRKRTYGKIPYYIKESAQRLFNEYTQCELINLIEYFDAYTGRKKKGLVKVLQKLFDI